MRELPNVFADRQKLAERGDLATTGGLQGLPRQSGIAEDAQRLERERRKEEKIGRIFRLLRQQ
jgi:hypothetical protein